MCSLMEHSDRSYREKMAAFQDALGDYYDAGAIGDPPKLADYPKSAENLSETPKRSRKPRETLLK